MVPVRAGTIRLGEAFRTLVRPEDGKAIDPESIRAHQLVWGEVSEAPPLAEVLPEIERRLGDDAVLLVHHRALDLGFLKRAFSRHRRHWPHPDVVDTTTLLRRLRDRERRRHPELPAETPVLNLARARRAHGLPDHPAHDALSDALATAELFLVLRKALDAKTLREVK
jgi:DNA polymerase-3 subunit epsilon